MDEAKKAAYLAFKEQQKRFQQEQAATTDELRRKAAQAYVPLFAISYGCLASCGPLNS
jgi:hypothetical protein